MNYPTQNRLRSRATATFQPPAQRRQVRPPGHRRADALRSRPTRPPSSGRIMRRPVESHTFAGMETAVQEQSTGRSRNTSRGANRRDARASAETSTHRAGEMEKDSPLFFGKD